MTGRDSTTAAGLPDTSMRVIVPAHVVYRSFPSETVALNLHTGTYHGLNTTAGRMLEELTRAQSIGQACELLAAQFAQPLELVQRDVCELCRALAERDLLRLDAGPSA
jgi:Coenzyme PQQ synthesis protein D (PqqD)